MIDECDTGPCFAWLGLESKDQRPRRSLCFCEVSLDPRHPPIKMQNSMS